MENFPKVKWLTFILVIMLLTSLPTPILAQADLHTGDLLFNVTDTTSASDFAKGIIGSTQGIDHMKVSHVAIVCREDSGICVIEATSKHGVWMCSLRTYLDNADHDAAGKPMVLLGRIVSDFDAPQSISNAKRFIGCNYDFTFDPSDEEMYCSELVQKTFVDHTGQLIFPTIPMSFHDEEGRILPFWIEYYLNRDLDVPEGEPGSNPGQISRDTNVKILGRADLHLTN